MTNQDRTSPLARALRSGLAVAALGLGLSGCISLAPKTPDTLIRLSPEKSAPAGTVSDGKLADAIVVLDPDADRSLDVLRVPVRVDASSLAYLKGAGWVEKPTRLMRSLLAETIRADTGGLVLEGGDYEVTGKTFVGGRLLEMGYDAPRHAVVVRFDAVITQRDNPEIRRKRFEAVVDNVEPKGPAVGPALNSAANTVANEVATWVKSQG
ncbi:ABC-type transport auxiliary lipoprotein family protein [Novosphingobium sp. 1949]|uniref:ABC-type transport auxiliary lipoprotein family protein n=1 Tax=Novosphingobium organovorum TaxID=2930092 RepID=A0ABT0BFR8_9SPHN|nr:ABC-type transport auxiliary lipoprotein family protein [Novosphingobium organovorum]MCJ2183889.1 ABC-type transport auxiliary lipoprotein family protein [Novosphingobium organovorum]